VGAASSFRARRPASALRGACGSSRDLDEAGGTRPAERACDEPIITMTLTMHIMRAYRRRLATQPGRRACCRPCEGDCGGEGCDVNVGMGSAAQLPKACAGDTIMLWVWALRSACIQDIGCHVARASQHACLSWDEDEPLCPGTCPCWPVRVPALTAGTGSGRAWPWLRGASGRRRRTALAVACLVLATSPTVTAGSWVPVESEDGEMCVCAVTLL